MNTRRGGEQPGIHTTPPSRASERAGRQLLRLCPGTSSESARPGCCSSTGAAAVTYARAMPELDETEQRPTRGARPGWLLLSTDAGVSARMRLTPARDETRASARRWHGRRARFAG